MEKSTGSFRPIRSYVLRQGRITRAQSEALNDEASPFLLSPQMPLGDGSLVFGKTAPITLEIGFGMGDSLLAAAEQSPNQHFIGIEVHAPGVGRVLHRVQLMGLTNVRVYHADAVQVLQESIGPDTLDKICVFFPDPWTKKRHHKRRLIQAAFVNKLLPSLKMGGLLHLATDVEDYAQWMQEVLEACDSLQNVYGPKAFAPNDLRPKTKFEHRGIERGHGIWDLIYRKVSSKPDCNDGEDNNPEKIRVKSIL